MEQPISREDAWSRLGQDTFDLLVVGGGVIGAAAARYAALKGLSVALVEANDFGSGTSSKSSKLVHGGLRYLEQGDLPLVFESVSERQTLMQTAPHLVRPLGFLFPIYKGDPVRLTTLRLGLFVYEGLAWFRSPKLHQNLSAADVMDAVPQIRPEKLNGAPLFWDCATDDARITLENVLAATEAGALCANYTRVSGLLQEDGRVAGAQITDTLDGPQKGRTTMVRARMVLNATGPWSDGVRSMTGEESRQIRLTKGVHIVFPSHLIDLAHTVVAFHPRDKRVLFIIPWGDQIYVGTTDTDYEGDPARVATEREDVDYLLEAVAAYFPHLQIGHDDITATWAGLRALIRAEGVPPSQVSREHVITDGPEGMVSIAGGKLTTHRRMGAEVVEHAIDKLQDEGVDLGELATIDTSTMPLPGAVGWPEDEATMAEQLTKLAGDQISQATASYLAGRYGTRSLPLVQHALSNPTLLEPLVAGRPEILGQVEWAVLQELATTVTDVMERRTQLFFRDTQQGLGAIDRVSRHMAQLLKWSDDQREASSQAYRVVVERSRSWRS